MNRLLIVVLGKEKNKWEEIAESGLEWAKSYLTRLSLLALFYLFSHSSEACSQTVKTRSVMDTDQISQSPIWVITFIFRGKCLEYLPIHFCG